MYGPLGEKAERESVEREQVVFGSVSELLTRGGMTSEEAGSTSREGGGYNRTGADNWLYKSV